MHAHAVSWRLLAGSKRAAMLIHASSSPTGCPSPAPLPGVVPRLRAMTLHMMKEVEGQLAETLPPTRDSGPSGPFHPHTIIVPVTYVVP
jgi:hypothetical protein